MSLTSWQYGSLPFRSSRSRMKRSKGDRDSVAGAVLSLGSSDSIGPFSIDRLTWSLWKSSCKAVKLIWYTLRLGFSAGRLQVKKLPLFCYVISDIFSEERKKGRPFSSSKLKKSHWSVLMSCAWLLNDKAFRPLRLSRSRLKSGLSEVNKADSTAV